jgi:predicted nucleic acid-binding protein
MTSFAIDGKTMPGYFIDSSAPVKRYRIEKGSQRLSELLKIADQVLISRLTIVEVSATIVRRSKQAGAPQQDLRATLSFLDADIEDVFDVVELNKPLLELAVASTRKHALRGADAIQLASAMLTRRHMPNVQLALIACDLELNAAAVAEGLQVENPNLHS